MRALTVLLSTLLVLFLFACGGGAGNAPSSTGGDNVVAKSPLPEGWDPSRLERWKIPADWKPPTVLKQAAAFPPPPYCEQWNLGYGKNMLPFGYVELTYDDENVYVKYVIDGSDQDGYVWGFFQTHLWIGAEFPPTDDPAYKNGKWIPGQFPYHYGVGQEPIDEPFPDTEYLFVVPLGDLPGEIGEIYFMTHCTINRELGDIDGDGDMDYKKETGWGYGEGDDPPYFPPNPPKPPKPPVPPPYKTVEIPDGAWAYTPTFNPSGNGSTCYWGINFTPNDPDLPPDGTPYCGWCVDGSRVMYGGYSHWVNLYDTVNDELNPWPDIQWDCVNYMINRKHQTGFPWGSGAGNYNVPEFQAALWWLLGEYTYPNYHSSLNTMGTAWQLTDAKALYDDAVANGEGYYPTSGEWFAVVLYDDDRVYSGYPYYYYPYYNVTGHAPRFQVNIIEVDP